ncbi:hypothetical protein [Campylobacter curvus]|uniref:hypothetical protein n=1 Tax=Campylobacter curvus TaxID=200 RepID=UPI0001593D0E|nr:hypothetical protein [Campylobacter curvus]
MQISYCYKLANDYRFTPQTLFESLITVAPERVKFAKFCFVIPANAIIEFMNTK